MSTHALSSPVHRVLPEEKQITRQGRFSLFQPAKASHEFAGTLQECHYVAVLPPESVQAEQAASSEITWLVF